MGKGAVEGRRSAEDRGAGVDGYRGDGKNKDSGRWGIEEVPPNRERGTGWKYMALTQEAHRGFR